MGQFNLCLFTPILWYCDYQKEVVGGQFDLPLPSDTDLWKSMIQCLYPSHQMFSSREGVIQV